MCDVIICQECINDWRNMNISKDKTPCCSNKPEEFNSFNKGNDRYVLDNLDITCMNMKDGCKEVTKLPFLNKHEVICPYRKVNCVKHENCRESGTPEEIEKHNSKCSYVEVGCPQCKNFFPRNILTSYEPKVPRTNLHM